MRLGSSPQRSECEAVEWVLATLGLAKQEGRGSTTELRVHFERVMFCYTVFSSVLLRYNHTLFSTLAQVDEFFGLTWTDHPFSLQPKQNVPDAGELWSRHDGGRLAADVHVNGLAGNCRCFCLYYIFSYYVLCFIVN